MDTSTFIVSHMASIAIVVEQAHRRWIDATSKAISELGGTERG
jgi:hypothetical protein